MDRKAIERAHLDAFKSLLSGDWIDAVFLTAEESVTQTFPNMVAIADEITPTSGRLRYSAVTVRIQMNTRAGDADSGTEAQHASRAKEVAETLESRGEQFLNAVNAAANGAFEMRGFVEGQPEYSIDDNDWRTEIRIAAGIVWLR
jgi:hypothetical protein